MKSKKQSSPRSSTQSNKSTRSNKPAQSNKPARSLLRRIAHIIHLISLSIWVGAVAMSGVVAAIVFPMMRKIEPTLATYPDYEGDHALLTGGLVASKVFFVVDIIQLICGTLALGSLLALILLGYQLRTIARVFRMLVLCTTLAILSYHWFFFMPDLQASLQGYWSFAQQGDTAQAEMFKDRFLASHSAASRLLGTITIAVLINIILAGWTLTDEQPESEEADGASVGASS